jgi:hypothetical protein
MIYLLCSGSGGMAPTLTVFRPRRHDCAVLHIRRKSKAHRRWIGSQVWTHAAERAVVEDCLLAIDHTAARLSELDVLLAELPKRNTIGAGGMS